MIAMDQQPLVVRYPAMNRSTNSSIDEGSRPLRAASSTTARTWVRGDRFARLSRILVWLIAVCTARDRTLRLSLLANRSAIATRSLLRSGAPSPLTTFKAHSALTCCWGVSNPARSSSAMASKASLPRRTNCNRLPGDRFWPRLIAVRPSALPRESTRRFSPTVLARCAAEANFRVRPSEAGQDCCQNCCQAACRRPPDHQGGSK